MYTVAWFNISNVSNRGRGICDVQKSPRALEVFLATLKNGSLNYPPPNWDKTGMSQLEKTDSWFISGQHGSKTCIPCLNWEETMSLSWETYAHLRALRVLLLLLRPSWRTRATVAITLRMIKAIIRHILTERNNAHQTREYVHMRPHQRRKECNCVGNVTNMLC